MSQSNELSSRFYDCPQELKYLILQHTANAAITDFLNSMNAQAWKGGGGVSSEPQKPTRILHFASIDSTSRKEFPQVIVERLEELEQEWAESNRQRSTRARGHKSTPSVAIAYIIELKKIQPVLKWGLIGIKTRQKLNGEQKIEWLVNYPKH